MAVKGYDFMMPAPDGVRLYTRVLLPGEGRYPTVLRRTPYDTAREITPELLAKAEEDPLLRHGYAVVLQHCRGRNGSEGECVPYAPEERSDGLETLARIRTMPHYNGEIFLSGASYTASVLLMLLGDPIPDLRAVSISVQTEDMYRRNYFNGLCRSFCGFSWWLSMLSQQRPRIAEDREIYVRPYRDLMIRATGRDLPAFTGQLLHDRFDAFWKNDPRIGVMEKLDVPVLMTGGWFDYYCYGMCSMWEKLKPETRRRSAFLMTPFGHDLGAKNPGDYPLPDGRAPADREAEWFDLVRFGKRFPYAAPGVFHYYRIGEGAWHDAVSPYENVPNTALYCTENGELTPAMPEGGSRSYFYDPETPLHHDPNDRMSLCAAPGAADVLSFVSAPFEKTKAFFGPVAFCAAVSTDCSDTAFFFRLFLEEDGKFFNLTDGATTLLYADPNYKKGGIAHLRVLSQPTAFQVKKGSRLRLDLSSWSDAFVPHANTAVPFALAKKTRIARNTVYCGESAVILPETPQR